MNDMNGCHGQFGWREFHRNRKDILAEFDRIAEQTLNRPVRTAHGAGVEAYLRKWLSDFLPRKFGVTSGYIIPSLYEDAGNLYHYDIIIYDALNSPVLWTEGNKDSSAQGRFRAIPAKHVVALYEVKARLTKGNVSNSLEKLRETSKFADQLHKYFSCGVVFVELKEADTNRESILAELSSGRDINGFIGGIVLRYEKDYSITGLIARHQVDPTSRSDPKHRTPLAKPIDEVDIYITEDGNLHLAEQGSGARVVATSSSNWSVTKMYGVSYEDGDSSWHLCWSRSNFADFCIDLIGRLEGLPFNDQRRQSFGQIFDSIARRSAKEQGEKPESGKPYLDVSLHPGGDESRMLEICLSSEPPTIQFWVKVENIGGFGVKVSDDGFKSECELPTGKAAIRPVNLTLTANGAESEMRDQINGEGFQFPYRLVYQHEKEFFFIEKTVNIKSEEISMRSAFTD